MLLDFVNNIVFRTYGTNTLDLNFKYSNKVENYFNKPKNGSVLFASPACNSEFDTWANFCKYEGFNEETLDKWVDFRITPNSRVWIIQSEEDVEILPRRKADTRWSIFSTLEVDYDKIFAHFDAIYINYNELKYCENEAVQDFINVFDCDTLCVRNLSKVEICHKRQYIYLKKEDWLRKYDAKKAHKGCWAKGFVDGMFEYEKPITFYFAHGTECGALEFEPNKFTDHKHIAKTLEEKAAAGKFSEDFYSRHKRLPEYRDTVITHGCFDGKRVEFISQHFKIKSATSFMGCTTTFVEGESTTFKGYLKIAICECKN